MDVSRHKYLAGEYTVQGYVRDKTGVLGNGQVVILYFAKNMTPIMGESQVTVQDLVAFYQKNSSIPYPATELGEGGAATLESFCQIYFDEARTEGVRAEVAFAQSMLETGFLKFGGDVKIDQYNFAGLGATGGVPGNSFPDVRTGIRAHIQHLKCYASTEPLNNPCVDSRWGEWLRGKAIYVEWLAIANNPNGTGWASDPNYASKICNLMDKIGK